MYLIICWELIKEQDSLHSKIRMIIINTSLGSMMADEQDTCHTREII